MPLGKVWLIGAGPGDPGLITVRGLEALTRAEVVLHDALAHPALLEACPHAELYNVGKRYGEPSSRQNEINERLIELAQAGKRVVRLKGGDPLLFARGGEEGLALAAAGIPFEIIPGIASPVAATAYSGIPLTHRELSSSVTFITGSDREGKEWSPEQWKKLATATDTICVLMGMRRIEEITAAIIDGGRSPHTSAAVIQWGARPEQRVATGTLGTIAKLARERGLSNPAIIVVGEVVSLRQELSWYDNRPLFAKRILIPRPKEQGKTTAKVVRDRGAEPRLLPSIELSPPADRTAIERAIRELATYDWVLFTSANGVERWFEELRAAGLDARAFANAKLGVIGPKTASSLASFGIVADLVAEEFVGEGLCETLLARGMPRRVLIPRALVARDTLPETLRKAGVVVDVAPIYETKPAKFAPGNSVADLLERGELDVVMFTSSSTVTSIVESLAERAQELLSRVVVASIGPITSRALTEHGIRVDVTAPVYTVDGILDALESHFAG